MSRKRQPLTQIPNDDNPSKRRRNHADCTINPIPNIRVGAILKMVLKNFMCHDLLEVPFENNVDFIIGRNGSGKSAILTALILGLGGRASLTNRGTSVKAFVKTGCSSANIKIYLNNEGPMGYKTSTYGRFIIIERNILSSGSSTYKIRSESGDIVTTRSKEIDNITINLNIQVDNPVCILNQDTARNFLNTSDPSAKYTLFNKATRLETLYEEYKQGIARWKQAEAHFKEKEEIFNELANEIDQLHQKIESHQNLQIMKGQVNELQRELLWSKVNDSEKDMDELKIKLEEVQKKYEEAQGSTEDKENRVSEIMESIREINQKINEIKEGIQQQEGPIRDVMREIDELKCKLSHKNREQQSTINEINNKKRETRDLQQEIDNFTAKMSEIEQKQLKRTREITEFQTRLKSLKEVDDTIHNELYQCNGNIKQKEEALHEVRHELESTKSKYSRTKEHIATLQDNTNNSLAVYGRCMFYLKEAITNNAKRFSQMPRGPLGSYIMVNDKKWTLAIESFLSGTLHSFCVNNQQDANLLFKLMAEVWDNSSKPSVITSKFFNKVHDVSNNIVKRVGNCISIYEAITVNDAIVMNCLIDQNNIENILLIPEVDQAIEIMSDSRNVPRNCGLGITMKGDIFYPDPNYKMYSSKYKRVKYLQVNTADAVRNHTKALKEYEESIVSLQSKYDELKKDLDQTRATLRDLQGRAEKGRDMIGRARKALAKLQSEEDINVSDVQQLDIDLKELNRSIERYTLKVEAIKEEILQLQEEIGEREQHLVKLKDARKVLELRIPPLEEQNKEQMRLRTEMDTKGEFDKRRKHELKKRIEIFSAQIEKLQRELELQIQQAEYLGQRLDELRNVPIIAEEMNELQRRVRQATMMSEDPGELLQQYSEKVDLHNDMKELMECIYSDIKELSKAYEKRKRRYKNMRDYFENFIEHCFKKFLKMRQFRGSLNINFTEKTLELIVLPHLTNNGVTASSNLSGGERSFSTVAFLYSLWQCLDFPFYFLDEFDVFMDKANRTKVMEILIHHAKTHKSTQFVFLTPQDMPFTNDKDVSVHRLEDPERRFTQ